MCQKFQRNRSAAANGSSSMEFRDHSKNGARPKSHTSRGNFLLVGILLLAFCAFTNKAMAWTGNGVYYDPWYIADGGGSSVYAYIDGSTLYIKYSGGGVSNMADFWSSTEGEAPWWFNESVRQAITTVDIENGVTNIGDRAFKDCSSLEKITIPSTVKIIGRQAFYNCTSTEFTEIKIPNTVTEIEGEAFRGCSNLKTVNIENGTSELNFSRYDAGWYDFRYDWFLNCPNLQTLHLGRNINWASSSSDASFISDIKATLSTLTIGNTVTAIGDEAFNGCNNLKTVTIDNGTTTLRFIGHTSHGHFKNSPIETLYLGRDLETEYISGNYSNSYPFAENSALKSVTIGNDVQAINDYSFKDCTGLQSLIMGSDLLYIGNQSFYGCSSLAGALSVPNKVKTIGYGAFQGCRTLPSATIPNSVTSIGGSAFYGCNNLKTVTIQDGTVVLRCVGRTSDNHFKNSPIETLYLGRDLETEYISGNYSNGYPFAENSELKSITIGNTVTTVNANSFNGCNGLTTITSQNPTPPTAGNNCFNGVNKTTCKVNVPRGTQCAYQSANQWKEFTNIVDDTNTACTNGINDVVATQLQIFPNPVKDDIFIQSDLQIEKVEIYSLTGSLLTQENNFNEKISISALPEGIYLLRIYTDKGVAVSKIVKE